MWEFERNCKYDYRGKSLRRSDPPIYAGPEDLYNAQNLLRESCVTQCCFVMLSGAKCNGRHAASC